MYIEKHDFNGRELIFDPRMNIIIGAHNSGKTKLVYELSCLVTPIGFDVRSFVFDYGDNGLKQEYAEGICFIEAIETRLHPNEQRRLIPNLLTEFPKVQFFITTYSPFIVQSAGRGQVIDMDSCDLSDVEFRDLPIDAIAYGIMGVESVHSVTEKEKEDISLKYLSLLNELKGVPAPTNTPIRQQLIDIETIIKDPVVRAQLRMNRIAAGVM